MITRLHVKNYKSHSNTEIHLSPLTVLTGVNGCGKTSLVETLLLLRQSYLKGRLMAGLDLNKPLCSIGVEQDARYRFSSDGIISIDFDIDSKETYSFRFKVSDNQGSSFIKKLEYSKSVIDERLKELSLFNNDFHYISASRWGGRSLYPKDTYLVEEQRQLSSENGIGDLVAHFLYYFGDEQIDSLIELNVKTALIDEVQRWESIISPNVTISTQPTADDNTGYVIRYGYKSSGSKKNIENLRGENVGFGISYSLAVITALLSSKKGSIVIIENPEAHIHPKGQSEFAQLIARVVDKGVQVIIETHSDHIINGLLRALKMKLGGLQGISPESLSIYYIGGKDEQQASVCQLVTVNADGSLDKQPDGFFDQIENDMYYIYNH